MALAGLKKQFNRTGQYLSEKIGAVEGTRQDEEFCELERKSDLTSRAVEQLEERVKEYLQPNPTTRAKMSALATLATLRGDNKQRPYPQVEGLLGESMGKLGRELVSGGTGSDDKSIFGESLIETGDCFKQLAEVKYGLEAQVGQTFFEPLHQLSHSELKEMHAHRKKLESRRLDRDGKKRKLEKGGVVPPDEMYMAEEKFEESRLAAESAMRHLLDHEVEQVAQLCELASAMADYYRQALTVVEGLGHSLQVRRAQAAEKARHPSQPKPRSMSVTLTHAQTLPKPRTTAPNAYGDDAWGSAPPAIANSSNTIQTSTVPRNDQSLLSLSAQDPFNLPPTESNSANSTFYNSQFQQQPQQISLQKPAPNPRTFAGAVRLPPPPSSPRIPQNNGYNSKVSMNSPSGGLSSYSPPPPYNPSAMNKPTGSCKALYDFVPENKHELAFKEADIIELISRVDENWFEGRLPDGRRGFFPTSYVQVLVPLP